MNERGSRLTTARRESAKSIRNLERDRANLNKQETKLKTQLKYQMNKGDKDKSRMILQHMLYLKKISDKNYARELFIQNEMLIRKSNHAVNQAHVEFLKGLRFANGNETIDTIRKREQKYHYMQDIHDSMETIRNYS